MIEEERRRKFEEETVSMIRKFEREHPEVLT
jgi:hypothetical protein